MPMEWNEPCDGASNSQQHRDCVDFIQFYTKKIIAYSKNDIIVSFLTLKVISKYPKKMVSKYEKKAAIEPLIEATIPPFHQSFLFSALVKRGEHETR